MGWVPGQVFLVGWVPGQVFCHQPSKREALTQFRLNVGTASQTVDQH